jgi:hypothetical protein
MRVSGKLQPRGALPSGVLPVGILFCTALLGGTGNDARTSSKATSHPQEHPIERDGQHDFDFEIGTWKTHLKVLVHPLTGSTTWIEFDGVSVVRKIWEGRANMVELQVDGPSGHLEALNLRLYNPESREWSLNFANSKTGTIGVPTIGEFRNGRGEFYDMEPINGRSVLVRNIWTDITPDSCHFEQAFSLDGGKTWETNWITTDTRVKEPDSSSK